MLNGIRRLRNRLYLVQGNGFSFHTPTNARFYNFSLFLKLTDTRYESNGKTKETRRH